MNDKKKAPGSAATLTGAAGGKSGETISMSQSTITQPPRQGVAEWLGVGEANAITMRELKTFLNGDSRKIRQQIERERRAGCPILSGQNGYWICASQDEAERFSNSMYSRITEMRRTVRAVRGAVGLGNRRNCEVDGQTDFWGGENG